MKRLIQVTKDNNNFTVRIGGKPTITSILSKDGELIRRSRINVPFNLSHSCVPGDYIVDTDGEIIEIEIKNIKIIPIIESNLIDDLDRTWNAINWHSIEDQDVKLDYTKEALIRNYSLLSFQLRNNILPDYKIQNAILGLYDENTTTSYRATIQKYRDEFHRLKEAIESAKTLEELKTVKANFPTEIVSPK